MAQSNVDIPLTPGDAKISVDRVLADVEAKNKVGVTLVKHVTTDTKATLTYEDGT